MTESELLLENQRLQEENEMLEDEVLQLKKQLETATAQRGQYKISNGIAGMESYQQILDYMKTR